ncbi:hypothetical protein G5C66_22305 [Nocardioides sp. KC13]|uniref:Uncharacterized protein n=1 Tax=Nocardioides turkmenicus TaxID=2711220 RepID=A0A6M1RD60_9ACTN|nr:hypothetical protein [Nocardioides sp. KC13]NGN95459.1 hypothetical protein [Nocardioides sp. KC13]
MTSKNLYVLGGIAAAGTAILLVLGAGALGIIGDGGRADMMYLAPIGIVVLGALMVRFRSRGMAFAAGTAAVATIVVGLIAIAAGLHDDLDGARDILMISALYAAMFAVSGWLFWRSGSLTR